MTLGDVLVLLGGVATMTVLAVLPLAAFMWWVLRGGGDE
jgi:hypothetical protein